MLLRARASSRCSVSPAALPDRPSLPGPAGDRVRFGSGWDPPASGPPRSTRRGRGGPGGPEGCRIPDRRGGAKHRSRGIGRVDVADARARRGVRQRIAAFAARHQALHDAGCDCPTRRQLFVLHQQSLGLSEDVLVTDRRDRDRDPVGTRPFVMGAVARADTAAPALWARDALTRRSLGLPEACCPL
jgi:hypothetical protein